jgi:putative phosphoesterase
MRIGLISDTHDKLPKEVFSIFADVDIIFHAGDIGSKKILDELEQIAPIRAVYGNVDTFPLATELKTKLYYKTEHYNICMTHIIGSPKVFAFDLLRNEKEIDIVISGHTHIPEHIIFHNIHFINPGSACYPRQSNQGSVAILNVNGEKPILDFFYLQK